jgi:hypothetical protein
VIKTREVTNAVVEEDLSSGNNWHEIWIDQLLLGKLFRS